MSYEQTAAHNKTFGIRPQGRIVGNLGNPDSPATFDSVAGDAMSIREECARLEPQVQLLNNLVSQLEERLAPILSGGYPPPPVEAAEGMSDMKRFLNGTNKELVMLAQRMHALMDRVTL